MDRLGVVGISWKACGPEGLARVTIPVEEREARLPGLAAAIGVAELAYLATCNRVEIALVGDGRRSVATYRPRVFAALYGREPESGEAERTFRAWAGEGAAEHLFLVAAGLDSARPGETEIAGQFKDAYERSRRAGLVGMRLELVFEHALRVAARVHRTTHVGSGRVSLAEIALDRVRARLQRTPGAVAVIGVSPMTQRTARSLRDRASSIVVVNRTFARAEELASEVGGVARSLERFRDTPDPVEALVSATGSPDAILDRAALEKLAARAPSGEPPLVVDMAVPPDIDPDDARVTGIERIGMNQVVAIAEENRRDRLIELADAREIVDQALDELRHRIIERHIAPVLAALQRRFRATAQEGVERLFRRDLRGLGDGEREAVARWAETLARRFAHIPTAGLRGVAHEGGPEALDAFLRALDEELASELRGSASAHDADAPAVPLDEERES